MLTFLPTNLFYKPIDPQSKPIDRRICFSCRPIWPPLELAYDIKQISKINHAAFEINQLILPYLSSLYYTYYFIIHIYM